MDAGGCLDLPLLKKIVDLLYLQIRYSSLKEDVDPDRKIAKLQEQLYEKIGN